MKHKPKDENAPRAGDLWLVKKLPPMLFVWLPDYGWMLNDCSLSTLLWTVEHRKKLNEKMKGVNPKAREMGLTESDEPPPGARRFAEE
jgi:hypothetical protein